MPSADRAQQQVLRRVPFVGLDHVDLRARAACAGIVEQDVEPAGGVRRLDQRPDVVGFRNIGTLKAHPPVRRLRQVAPRRLVDITDPHLGALIDQSDRGGTPDTRCSAGHDGTLARKAHGRHSSHRCFDDLDSRARPTRHPAFGISGLRHPAVGDNRSATTLERQDGARPRNLWRAHRHRPPVRR